jgi:heme A synthase
MANAISVSSDTASASENALHRFAVVGVACANLGVLTGAMVTSSGDNSFLLLHEFTATGMAVVLAALAIWMAARHVGGVLSWILLALVIAEGGLGHVVSSPSIGILHALLGQILFAVSAAAATLTSPAWIQPAERVEDHGWPSLRSLGAVTPYLVLAQVALGACFRHKVLGVLPHLFGAMVLVLVILCVCIFVMQQFPKHKVLRSAAHMLLAIAFTQIFLGIAAFTVRTMTTQATPTVVYVTAVHATVGAMTLAAAVVLAMQIRRNVFKPQPSEESETN